MSQRVELKPGCCGEWRAGRSWGILDMEVRGRARPVRYSEMALARGAAWGPGSLFCPMCPVCPYDGCSLLQLR